MGPYPNSIVHSGMDGVNISDRSLVSHIKDALVLVHSGDTNEYNILVAEMHQRESAYLDNAVLETTLKALSELVSYIDIVYHESLLSAIFGMSMWNCGAPAMNALIDLLVRLAASNAKYVDSCLDALVCNFMPPYYFLAKLTLPHVVRKKELVISGVHKALKDLADLLPLSPLRLLPIVRDRMPSIYKSDKSIVLYIENMLKLESGALGGLVGSTILMAVMDRLLEMDVEIGWDGILQDDFVRGIFDMELEDMDDDADDQELDGVEGLKGSLSRKSLTGNAVAELLDSLVMLTFEHLESCKVSGRLTEVFETLLKSFEVTVMNAYKSKFAQFVIFYACALDSENCGVRFPTRLADIFANSKLPLSTRLSAMGYLASYLSRAKFLSDSFIVGMLSGLVQWCLQYCQVQNGDINPEAHRLFYSGCQGIMYVLCFRMKSIMDVPRLKAQLLHMPLEQILHHKMNPLQVCLPSVVEEFLRQAKVASLFIMSKSLNFYELLESEEHSRGTFGGGERLDMFFPFDPCLLKKSDSWIRPYYVFWSMVRATYDDADCSDGDGEEDRILDEQDIDEFNIDINKMSITPKTSFGFKSMRMPSRIRASTSPESL
ncbi:hypothetical protein ACFE04_021759 [Oxalis oulophora]